MMTFSRAIFLSMNFVKKIEHEISFSFSKSSGAGGQNVNKVNTKATLSWNFSESLILSERIKSRFEKKYSKFLFSGVFKISSQRSRSQQFNKDDCLEKLNQMLIHASKEPKRRKKTKKPKSAIEKRIKNKKINSLKKQFRTEKHY